MAGFPPGPALVPGPLSSGWLRTCPAPASDPRHGTARGTMQAPACLPGLLEASRLFLVEVFCRGLRGRPTTQAQRERCERRAIDGPAGRQDGGAPTGTPNQAGGVAQFRGPRDHLSTWLACRLLVSCVPSVLGLYPGIPADTGWWEKRCGCHPSREW